MSFQHSPTLSTSGGANVLTRSQRRRHQEARVPPHSQESFVANPITSVGNEGQSVVFQEV